MMAFVGLFMGGSPHAMIPAGQAVINLQWQAEDRQDIQGASFTVTGPGVNKTIPAGADGRATATVGIGTYTVSVTHAGAYLGDDPLTVTTESQKAYQVFFDGKIDQSIRVEERIRAVESKLDSKQDKTWKLSSMEADKSAYNEIFVIYRFAEDGKINQNSVGSTAVLPITGTDYEVNLTAMAGYSNYTQLKFKSLRFMLKVASNGVLSTYGADSYFMQADIVNEQVPGGHYGQYYKAPSHQSSSEGTVTIDSVYVR